LEDFCLEDGALFGREFAEGRRNRGGGVGIVFRGCGRWVDGFGGLGGFVAALVGGALAGGVDGNPAGGDDEECARGFRRFYNGRVFPDAEEQFL